MIVHNLTKSVQTIRVHELVGGNEYEIYIQPASEVDVDNSLTIVNLKDLSGKVEPVVKSPEARECVVETVPLTVEDVSKDSEEILDIKEPEVLSSTFVCEICHSEFASERGLNAHMSRAHKE